MKGDIGRKPIKIIESLPYSQIIFLISFGKNYAKIIAESRNVEVFPTTQQLQKLKEKKYLISLNEQEGKNFPQNKTLYLVNWKKISSEFVDYVFEMYKKEYDYLLQSEIKFWGESKLKEIAKSWNKEYPNETLRTGHTDCDILFNKTMNKDFEKSIKNNPYLHFILYDSFSKMNYSNRTIKEVFEEFRKLSLLYMVDNNILDGLKNNLQDIENNSNQINKEYVEKVRREFKNDILVKELNDFISICQGIRGNESVGIENLNYYLKIKYSLISCPDNPVTKEDINNEELKELVNKVYEDNPNLREKIDKLRENSSETTKSKEVTQEGENKK